MPSTKAIYAVHQELPTPPDAGLPFNDAFVVSNPTEARSVSNIAFEAFVSACEQPKAPTDMLRKLMALR